MTMFRCLFFYYFIYFVTWLACSPYCRTSNSITPASSSLSRSAFFLAVPFNSYLQRMEDWRRISTRWISSRQDSRFMISALLLTPLILIWVEWEASQLSIAGQHIRIHENDMTKTFIWTRWNENPLRMFGCSQWALWGRQAMRLKATIVIIMEPMAI